jgi:hypothetical protein
VTLRRAASAKGVGIGKRGQAVVCQLLTPLPFWTVLGSRLRSIEISGLRGAGEQRRDAAAPWGPGRILLQQVSSPLLRHLAGDERRSLGPLRGLLFKHTAPPADRAELPATSSLLSSPSVQTAPSVTVRSSCLTSSALVANVRPFPQPELTYPHGPADQQDHQAQPPQGLPQAPQGARGSRQAGQGFRQEVTHWPELFRLRRLTLPAEGIASPPSSE